MRNLYFDFFRIQILWFNDSNQPKEDEFKTIKINSNASGSYISNDKTGVSYQTKSLRKRLQEIQIRRL